MYYVVCGMGPVYIVYIVQWTHFVLLSIYMGPVYIIQYMAWAQYILCSIWYRLIMYIVYGMGSVCIMK